MHSTQKYSRFLVVAVAAAETLLFKSFKHRNINVKPALILKPNTVYCPLWHEDTVADRHQVLLHKNTLEKISTTCSNIIISLSKEE